MIMPFLEEKQNEISQALCERQGIPSNPANPTFGFPYIICRQTPLYRYSFSH